MPPVSNVIINWQSTVYCYGAFVLSNHMGFVASPFQMLWKQGVPALKNYLQRQITLTQTKTGMLVPSPQSLCLKETPIYM